MLHKMFSAGMAVVIVGSMVCFARAATETVNGVTWTYTVSGSSVTVTNANLTYGVLSIPSSLGNYPVTTIANNAFRNKGITAVTIPDTVTRIYAGAFSGCPNLASVTMSDSVTSIGDNVFANCANLTSVSIPESVTSIGSGAFGGCSKLLDTVSILGVHLVDGWAVGSADSLSGTLTLEGIRGIATSAFEERINLKSVIIGNGMKHMGMSAFRFCKGLTNAIIGEGLTAIPSDAFSGCPLANVTIPNSATSIGYAAFSRCSLRNLIIGDNVSYIGEQAFWGNYSLRSVSIPPCVKEIGSLAFFNCGGVEEVYIRDLAAWCEMRFVDYSSNPLYEAHHLYLNGEEVSADLVIPGDITKIGKLVFNGFLGLKSVKIPSSVTNVEQYAFSNCTNLLCATITSSSTKVATNAFKGCSGLLALYVPLEWKGTTQFDAGSVPESCTVVYGKKSEVVDGVTWNYVVQNGAAIVVAGDYTEGLMCVPEKLGGRAVTAIMPVAFYNCTGLVAMTIPDSVTNIGAKAFAGCRNLKTLRVPASWEGTQLLDDTEVPEDCIIQYGDDIIGITPSSRNFTKSGGGAGIVVSGSGMWTAVASEPWITLNTTIGETEYPVTYTVSATTNVEQRTGYVYVSGHAHTVVQDGIGGSSLSPIEATLEWEGGTGSIAVTAPSRIGWKAESNCDWVHVTPTGGAGEGSVTFRVEPLNEVSTRQGTLTVAGQTFTVFQYGRRMKLSPTTATYDYFTHVIPITVDALAITEWSVTPNASWISVVDAGKGKGGDLVTIAIAENPSWKARTGTVSIGTETFTVTQEGRMALAFAIDPVTTTASVEGANGMIAVTATPDLPWSAASKANWLTVYAATANGAGNGNVVYSAAPNPTLYERTGTIVVTPGDTNVAAKTHTATQPAAISALSATGYEFEASGESCEVRVSLSDIVEWKIENTNGWLTVVGASNRVGPGTVTLQASANTTVYPKSGTVTIARKPFAVSQKARGVEVEYETKLFGTDGGYDSISIHPDGQVSWTAVSSDPTWITIFQGDSGTGDGEILYIVSPYVGTGEARTGTITVGDKVVWITQRGYDLSINPAGSVVAGNNGAGEFGVSAGIGDVWRAIVTEPWITIIEGYDEGTGSGMVRFAYADNNTGKMRTGKIIVAGEVYTLTQKAREFVAVSVEAGHGGSVEGAGTYDLGATVTLTAVPDSGYAFSHWTGAVESMENPLVFRVDVPKSFTAVFAPLPIAFTKVTSATNGVTLAWNPLAWATTFRIFRGVTSVPSSATVVAELPNTGTCEWLDETGEVDVEYWYWIEAEGLEDEVMSDPMTGKKKWGWPAAQNEGEVAAALDGAADARLGSQIGSVEEYEAFRAWAAGEGREEKEVRDSAHAWPSYALGAEELFENEPTIQIDGFTEGAGADNRRAAGFSWAIRVAVKDGERAVGVDAEKVAALFEATRRIGDWTETSLLPLTVRATGKDGNVLLFDVTIESENVPNGFLRLGHGDMEAAVPEEPETGAKYLVVDLSGGPTAASWPVTYLDGEPEGGFNTDEYKTTKLVLRRIEAGTFMMDGDRQTTLTKPYYMGVFEVTQKQYELVTGSNPSGFLGDMRPVEQVSWYDIRGDWTPVNGTNHFAVDANLFLGRLQSRTGLEFDLPTISQWQYACRAGTTTVYGYGDSEDGNYMWYSDNSSQTHDVGTKKPNPWGLYDMHGNVGEWCLDDWFGLLMNPDGSSLIPLRFDSQVLCGGSWCDNASYCTSSSLLYFDRGSAKKNSRAGFRTIVRTQTE